MKKSKCSSYIKMKLHIIAIILVAFGYCLYSTAYSNNVSVFVDNKKLIFDVNPRIQNDRVLVPFRTIFETLGANVSFNSSTQTVTAIKENTTITLYINKKSACVNDLCHILDTESIIENGRTLVPLRFLSEALKYSIQWDSKNNSVYISSTQNKSIKPIEIKGDKFNQEVLQSKNPVFVDIYASWCGPCKIISPIIDEIAGEMNGSLKFIKIDGDIESASLQTLNVKYEYFPTLRIYKDGKIVHEIRPSSDKKYLKEQINIGLSKIEEQ